MLDRPYRHYSTTELRELSGDFVSSQLQLEDQRADYVKRVCADDDDLRQLDILINGLSHQRASIEQELVIRHRDGAAVDASGRRAVTRRRETR